MKTILEKISEKPQHVKLYIYLFTCWGFSLTSLALGNNWESWIAAGFVISALIDLDA